MITGVDMEDNDINNWSLSDTICVFAAGGQGRRMQSVNNTLPKPLLRISGKPILEWGLECLISQGIKNFIITVSHLGDQIMEYFGDGRRFGCKIEYYYEEKPMGNAGALFKLWDAGKLTDVFLYLIADAVFDINIERFFSFHYKKNALASLLCHPNSHPFDSSLILTGKRDVVAGWLNKGDVRPKYYKNSVNAGIQILSLELLELSHIKPGEEGNAGKQITVDLDRDLLKPMVSTGRIYSYRSTEYCKDAGTPERFIGVEKDIKAGLVRIKNTHYPQRAIFLDRDGTINKYVGFLRDIDDFELLPDAAEAIRFINDHGFLVIVVTNQPVIARGEVTWDELETIHNKMETLLGEEGAYLDAIYFCPHHPDKGFAGEIESLKINCGCRKPKPGLLLQAAKDFNIDLNQSWMIGDSLRDIEAGKNAGCKTILLTGEGTENGDSDKDVENSEKAKPDFKCKNLLSAVNTALSTVAGSLSKPV